MYGEFKYEKCDCGGYGCEKCTCCDCGEWLETGEEDKCNDCIEKEEDD